MPIYPTENKKDGVKQYKVVVNYTDSAGKYRQKTKLVYGKDAAFRTEYEMSQSVSQGAQSDSLTLQQLYEQYVAAKAHEIRESSLDKSKSILNRHVLPILGNKKLKGLTVKVLQDWKNTINGLDLKLQTKNNIYTELRTLLNFAFKMEYIPSNNLLKLGGFKDGVSFDNPQDKIHFYTAEQFQKYIAVARASADSTTAWGMYVFFNIAFYTGMRKGEINALKWSDIEGNIIHVRRSVAQKLKGKSIVETPPKNKSSYRDIQAPLPLLKILEEHKARQQELAGFSNDFRVCGAKKCLSDSGIDSYNRRYATEADLPHIRVHDFRHTHATLLINEGINIQEIARRLGHSNTEITWKTYAHLYPREEERALNILNNLEYLD